jgi:hypothetical protein
MRENGVRGALREQAGWCRKLGSPFTAMVCDTLADRLVPASGFARRILAWPDDPRADAVALRAAAALHDLARSGAAPALSAVYPPRATPNAATWWRAAERAMIEHDRRLTDFLDSPPQTNEVARSGAVLGALLTIAHGTRLPLNLLEIGASAGLLLGLDRYRYELGVGRWGDAEARVVIRCAWSGAAPRLDAPLRIARRAGCDQSPLDPSSSRGRDRLMAFIWPDQAERLARMDAALEEVALRPWRVEQADAAAWLERKLRALPTGEATVLFHTVVWQYLTMEVKQRIMAAIDAAAGRATTDAPLARVQMEGDGNPDSAGLRLTVWPGGEERLIARADYHGRWVRWL